MADETEGQAYKEAYEMILAVHQGLALYGGGPWIGLMQFD